ncbi:MAG: leucine-rich repeat domain-containing protein, partial [Bacteroidaceae bacterium]|nr:leucine-rich repeat domain-containing protein [Bacteroidaceae bacterium]
MKQKIIQVLMLSGIFLLMSTSAHAQADTPINEWSFASSYVTIDNIRYQLDTTHKLAQWFYWPSNAAPEEVVIPSTVTYQDETYTVVSAKGATYTQPQTKSLTLPATLRHIGEYVFYAFPNIHEFVIPAAVESLDRYITRDNTVLRFQGT